MGQFGSWTWADVAVIAVFGVAFALVTAIGAYVVWTALTRRREAGLEVAAEQEPARGERSGPGRSIGTLSPTIERGAPPGRSR